VLAAEAVPVVGVFETLALLDCPTQLDGGALSPLHTYVCSSTATTAMQDSLITVLLGIRTYGNTGLDSHCNQVVNEGMMRSRAHAPAPGRSCRA
jgi:hypothetical protein